MNPKTLITVHGYSGDKNQVEILLPYYTHHECPVLILSPTDSPIRKVGPHHCRFAGLREYYGQKSWDRQHAQLKVLLEYKEFDWFLLNDSDSLCLSAKLPDYLYEDDNCVYSNEVDDFRIPGQSWQGQEPWPLDYHSGHKLCAMQPSYWLHRKALENIVAASEGMIACPITPFIDWWWVPACKLAGVDHKPFRDGQGASCETVTPNGIETMARCVREGAVFIHAIKNQGALDLMAGIYNKRNGLK